MLSFDFTSPIEHLSNQGYNSWINNLAQAIHELNK